jgi:hypothetical protein
MKALALLLIASLPAAAQAEPTGSHNSRLAVARALEAEYGLSSPELSAELAGGRDVQLNGATTTWAVAGRAGGRQVRARTVCKRTLFYYNKYDRAYRNECQVLSLSVR